MKDGPTMFSKANEKQEFTPILELSYDPYFITHEEYVKMDKEEINKYFLECDKDKIGGIPSFFRGDDFPDGEWMLLLQINESTFPLCINLGGNMSKMFVFITKDFKQGGLLIQN